MVEITACHTNLVYRVSLPAGKQRKGARDVTAFELILLLSLVLAFKSEGPLNNVDECELTK